MFQLSFLNAGILFLAAATVVPILIYLFISKKPKKIIFSTLKHIKASQQRQKKKVKLKNLLLLIIRCLVILLTILAIARPAIRTPLLHRWSRHSQTAVAVILDTSYSMDYLVDTRTELEIGKEIIKQINLQLTDRDVVTLLTSDADWNRLYANNHYGEIPENLLGGIEITALPISLEELVEQAENKLRESQILNREIYLINDFREQDIPENSSYPIFVIPTSDNEYRNNISCQNAKIVEDFVERRLNRRVSFDVVNHSHLNQNDVITQLFVNGRTVAERVVDLQPYERKSENFELSIEQPGWYQGFVSIRNERMQFDNRSYFSFYNEREPKVAVITDRERLPLSLTSILDIFTGSNGRIEIVNDDNLNLDRFRAYSLVIVYDKSGLSPRLRFLLESFRREEIGVLHLPASTLDQNWIDYYREHFRIELQNLNQEQRVRINYINSLHPIMNIFSDPAESRIELNGFWESQPVGETNLLLQSERYPLALENERELIWLFDTGNLSSPFLLNPMFPVMAYRTFLYCANLEAPHYQVGERVTIPEGKITLPNGETVSLNERNFQINAPGIYRIPVAEDNERQIAVNIDYSLSDYQRIDASDADNLYFLDQSWESEILRNRYGFELWKYIFILVLLLVFLEMYIVKREEKRGHTEGFYR